MIKRKTISNEKMLKAYTFFHKNHFLSKLHYSGSHSQSLRKTSRNAYRKRCVTAQITAGKEIISGFTLKIRDHTRHGSRMQIY